MSIQSDCRTALNQLAREGQVFTEIDVANQASVGKGWTAKLFKDAAGKAYDALTNAYRAGKLARYGPVSYDGHQDYARKGTKIVYADARRGPSVWETPNGDFPRLLAENDPLARPGRKAGTSRDDTLPWTDQKENVMQQDGDGKGPPIDTKAERKAFEQRIAQLEAELRHEREANANGSMQVEGRSLSDEDKRALIEAIMPELEEKVVERVRNNLAEVLIS